MNGISIFYKSGAFNRCFIVKINVMDTQTNSNFIYIYNAENEEKLQN